MLFIVLKIEEWMKETDQLWTSSRLSIPSPSKLSCPKRHSQHINTEDWDCEGTGLPSLKKEATVSLKLCDCDTKEAAWTIAVNYWWRSHRPTSQHSNHLQDPLQLLRAVSLNTVK